MCDRCQDTGVDVSLPEGNYCVLCASLLQQTGELDVEQDNDRVLEYDSCNWQITYRDGEVEGVWAEDLEETRGSYILHEYIGAEMEEYSIISGGPAGKRPSPVTVIKKVIPKSAVKDIEVEEREPQTLKAYPDG